MSAITYIVMTVLVVFTASAQQSVQRTASSMVGSLSPVHELVRSGKARFSLISKVTSDHITTVNLVLNDYQAKPVSGYAAPYLPSNIDAGLLWKDFVNEQLLIRANPQQITVKEQRDVEGAGYAVGFVLDHSPSMTVPRAVRMQRAVQSALNTFDVADFVSVVKFTSRVKVEVPLTDQREEYMNGFQVNGLNLRSDGTAIYDAAIAGMEELSKAPKGTRKVLVLFTDGEDNSSSAKLEEVTAFARANNILIHCIAYGVSDAMPLYAMSEQTGGSIHTLRDVFDFDNVFMGLYTSLRNSYTIAIDSRVEEGEELVVNSTLSVGSYMGGLQSSAVLAMLPKERVDVSEESDKQVVVSVDLAFDNNGISAADASFIDSVATLLVQQRDVSMEILHNAESGIATEKNTGISRAQAIRKELIKRGVQPNRVMSYASASPMLSQRQNASRGTTFVFSR
jgi:outer membrane protein OmpA-like peptidoglycan-associated protein